MREGRVFLYTLTVSYYTNMLGPAIVTGKVARNPFKGMRKHSRTYMVSNVYRYRYPRN